MDSEYDNPLSEGSRSNKPLNPCVLVIFGVTGDLTARKLMPAIYNLSKEGSLPMQFSTVGFARRDKTHESFRKEMKEAVSKYSRSQPIDEDTWNSFEEKLFYHKSEFDKDEGYESLKLFLDELDSKFNTQQNRVFYLATQPSFFPNIIEKLSKHGLISEEKSPFTRVIIEKPFGSNYESSSALQNHISKFLKEDQIYRIDHYLGKETVQNLLIFRFSNSIFEAIWNRRYIDHVQITVGEDIGIGSRGRFWEETGLLRDIIQNHMMQLLSLVAMEPPSSLSANSIRDEKVKVLQALRPIPLNEVRENVVRGQYDSGYINAEKVNGYREEENVDPNSTQETYLAMKVFIDNWRWAGVPFFLRSGKRLPKRATEIAIVFHNVPGILFQKTPKRSEKNVLVIRIQPDEGISLKMNCKVPSLPSPIQPVKMDFRYGTYFGLTPPEAYERLICDCMIGDSTLFARDDEVLASWKFLEPLLEYFKNNKPDCFPNYKAGTWGPDQAVELLEKSNRKWRLI